MMKLGHSRKSVNKNSLALKTVAIIKFIRIWSSELSFAAGELA